MCTLQLFTWPLASEVLKLLTLLTYDEPSIILFFLLLYLGSDSEMNFTMFQRMQKALLMMMFNTCRGQHNVFVICVGLFS